MAQPGLERGSPTLCMHLAGQYIVGVIPLDHCTFWNYSPVSLYYWDI